MLVNINIALKKVLKSYFFLKCYVWYTKVSISKRSFSGTRDTTINQGAGVMAQCLRAHFLVEVWGLISSTRVSSQLSIIPV